MTEGLQIKCKTSKTGNGISNAHTVRIDPLTLIKDEISKAYSVICAHK